MEALIGDDTYSKLDHGLIKSDLNPRDRQNFKSCIKLISEDVMYLMERAVEAKGTLIYLKLLRMVVEAYIIKSNTVETREFLLPIENEKQSFLISLRSIRRLKSSMARCVCLSSLVVLVVGNS